MPKLTLEEKRLEQLRRQLSGKESPHRPKESVKSGPSDNLYQLDQRNITPSLNYSPNVSGSDTLYLRKDLLKVLLLSGLAIAVELFLYFGSKNHFLNLSI